MSLVVQKFGGTSLRSDADRARATEKVQAALAGGGQCVVVVSAMGRRGDPYATDTLLSMMADAVDGARARETAQLMACGEIISAAVFAAELRSRGVNATMLSGGDAGIVTDDAPVDARILHVDPKPLEEILRSGRIPVVAGFQGKSEKGTTTTLGRGGSDTTAAAFGAAMGAQMVEIYTDVDGIKTADPTLVPQAKTIRTIDYMETFQLASTGAKVIHPRAVEIARQFNLPLRIRHTFSDDEGTLIHSSRRLRDLWPEDAAHRVVNVSHGGPVLQLLIDTHQAGKSVEDVHQQVFGVCARAGLSVDLINVSPERISFTVAQGSEAQACRCLSELGVRYEVRRHTCKVSIIGSAIHGVPGVMSVLVNALHAANVPLLASSDSHASISVLVPESDVSTAVGALHDAFHLSEI